MRRLSIVLTVWMFGACSFGTEADQRTLDAALVDWILAGQTVSTTLGVRVYDGEADTNPLSLTAPVTTAAVQLTEISIELQETEFAVDLLPFGGLLGFRSIFQPLHAHGDAASSDGSAILLYGPSQTYSVTDVSSISGYDAGGRPYFEWSNGFTVPPGTVKRVRLHLRRLTLAGTVNGTPFVFDRQDFADPSVTLKCTRSGRGGETFAAAVVIDLSVLFRSVTATDPGLTIRHQWQEALFLREHECYAL